MALPSPGTWKDKMLKNEYQNWLAVGHALLLMCEGVRPYVEREIKAFHATLLANLALVPPCTCATVSKHNKHCAWAAELKRYHRGGRPMWKQSDSTKWSDPNLGYWEIAKLYMSDLGPHAAALVDAQSADTTKLSNLMFWCTFFQVPHALVLAVRQVRNTSWGHAPNQELSDAEKTDAIETIKDLLKDPELAADPDAQDSLAKIDQMGTYFDAQSVDRQVLLEAVKTCDMLTTELKQVETRISRVEKESKIKLQKSNRIQRKVEHLQRCLTKEKGKRKELVLRLQDVEGRQIEDDSWAMQVGKVAALPFSGLRAMLCGKFRVLIFILLLCFTLLDHNSYEDGECI